MSKPSFPLSRIVLTLVLAIGWIFSGWPRIWQNPPIPPEVLAAQALPPTDVSAAPRFDFPLANVQVRVDGGGEAKIDLAALSFNLPADAGELELYAIQDECPSVTVADLKRNILTCPYRDPIGFSVLRPESYVWRIDRPTRIVIGACRSSTIDCGNQPQDVLIGFVSRDPLPPNMPQGLAPVAPQ